MKFDATRYRKAVLKTRAVNDDVRVLLLVMLDSADARGHVSIARSQLAEALGRSPKTVTDRIGKATAAGWLGVVQKGAPPRQTAVWALLFGTAARREPARPRLGDDEVHRRVRGEHVPTSDGPGGGDPVPTSPEVTPSLRLEGGPRPHPTRAALCPETQGSEVGTGVEVKNHRTTAVGRRQAGGYAAPVVVPGSEATSTHPTTKSAAKRRAS